MLRVAHAVCGVAILLLIACDSSTESKFLGRWLNADSGGVIEFFPEGRLTMGDKDRSVSGTWVALPDGRVRVEVSRGAQFPTDSFTATIDGDTFQVEAAGAKGATFKRQ